jgi:hypothetical protein
MPVIIGLFILSLMVFQLFFRYSHWPSRDIDGVVYEHDTLSGQVHLIKPGEPIDPVARLLGWYQANSVAQQGSRQTGSSSNLAEITRKIQDLKAVRQNKELFALSMTDATRAETAPDKQQMPPEPVNKEPHFVSRKLDLNQDGTAEEVIQSISADDGLVDISIVRPSGQELLYERALSLHILSTRHLGWADISLQTDKNSETHFRYNPKVDAYQRVER